MSYFAHLCTFIPCCIPSPHSFLMSSECKSIESHVTLITYYNHQIFFQSAGIIWIKLKLLIQRLDPRYRHLPGRWRSILHSCAFQRSQSHAQLCLRPKPVQKIPTVIQIVATAPFQHRTSETTIKVWAGTH